MVDKGNNLQDEFLNQIRKTKVPVTIFLVNGVKLQGGITSFDSYSILLRRDSLSQLVYKHAISTVMPLQHMAFDTISEENLSESDSEKAA